MIVLYPYSLYLGILARATTNMRKNQPIHTTARKYNDAPQVDVNELAEKWVEMIIERLMSKDKEGLQKTNRFPKLDTA